MKFETRKEAREYCISKGRTTKYVQDLGKNKPIGERWFVPDESITKKVINSLQFWK